MAGPDDAISVDAGPLRAVVSSAGELRVGWGEHEPDWFGPARLETFDGARATDVRVRDDGITFDAGWVRASVRAHDTEPVVVLRLEARSARDDLSSGAFATPVVAWHFDPLARAGGGAPEGLRAFGHQYTEFALPVFSDDAMERWRLLPFRPPVVMPLGAVAPDGRTLLLAPLDAFHEQIISVPANRDDPQRGVRAGWHGDVAEVPAGFATELAVIAGDGPRACFATWARLLRAASGVAAPARDADVLGTRVSYWTDNGSAYWYRTEPGLDMASTIAAAVDDLEARGVPVGAVQLDSWWYPHEVLRAMNAGEEVVPPTGMIRWEPRADVFPDGIPALRERLGRRPLVTHTRHLSSSSIYCSEFPVWADADRAHPQGPELYERLLDQAVAWGVEVFEHDWLIECFLGVPGLRAAGRAAAWQEGIDDALHARGLHAQWCMASPADFAQASRLRHVTSIRTSGDHAYLVEPQFLWAWFLHNNVMARALGLWPYKDVFHSAPDAVGREVEALLSALSAGPVGIGDAVGVADPALVRRTCRADGVLVRPDVPIAATDRAAFDVPVWNGPVLVASAHTQHASGRWGYVLAANVAASKERASAHVALAGVGEDRPASARVAVYDWRRGTVEIVDAAGGYDVDLEAADWDLRVLAPVLPGDVAVIGDPGLYATAGDARIADVVADAEGRVVVSVLGASEQVTVAGWSGGPLRAHAWAPATGRVESRLARDDATGAWRVTVDVGANGWTHLTLTR